MSKTNVLQLSVKQTVENIRFNLTEDGRNEYNEEIAKTMIEVSDKREKLKEISREAKVEIKRLEANVAQRLQIVRQGYVDENVEVHNVPDYDKGIIEFMDEEGTLVGSRKMLPSERQKEMFTALK